MKLLEEILSDYPRIWEFYKHHNEDKSRNQKFSQRYPLPMGTLSLIISFHSWTHSTTNLISESVGISKPEPVKKTETGPCPSVMNKINWINCNWHAVETRAKSLSKTLGDDIAIWHSRIREKVNDGDVYAYQPTMVCGSCSHRSVVRMNDRFICVNNNCRNPLTGEWLSWQIN